jgi:DNA-binding transcriptional ArsR family regulator
MLKELFISEVRVKMLRLFLLENVDQERGLHVRAITRRVGTEINAVRRELLRLTKLKMLKREDRGNRVYYRLRDDFSLKPELIGLLVKEEGIGREIIAGRRRFGSVSFVSMSLDFVFGRIPKPSEVDIIFVGSVSVEAVQQLMKREEAKRGREIHYSILGDDEFSFRKQKRDAFILDILIRPRVMLIGDELEFARMP